VSKSEPHHAITFVDIYATSPARPHPNALNYRLNPDTEPTFADISFF
jgi:hypothetical protein